MNEQASDWRATAPVFVVGAPRSGTTLLYNMILSSGNFADYQVESNAFTKIGLAFGSLRSAANRKKLLDTWLKSDLYRRTGLDAQEIRHTLETTPWTNAGDFLRIVMESMARKQGVERWAEKTPGHALYIPEIKKTLPNALFIHIIRDGRDSAMSFNRMDEFQVLPWDKKQGLLVCAFYWLWHVQNAVRDGRALGDHYMEVHYEDLMQHPHETLARLGAFIHHDLDYDRIQRNGVGVVKKPNTSYRDSFRGGPPATVGRWKDLAESDLARLNGILGPFLKELGYEVEGPSTIDFTAWRLRTFYPLYRRLRHALKQTAPAKYLIAKTIFEHGNIDDRDMRWEVLSERPR